MTGRRLIAVSLALAAIPAWAQSLPPTAQKSVAETMGHPSQVSIPNSVTFDFKSGITNRNYNVQVSLPDVPPPPEGYPVIYVMDGKAHFPVFAATVRRSMLQRDRIVVGVDYENRFYDLTPPSGQEASVDAMKMSYDQVGGADKFIEVMESEIKPRIEAMAKVNKKDQALFGQSLGGLFVLHTLLSRPELYNSFLSSSASIYWSHQWILKNEPSFREKVLSGKANPRIMIAVGDEERMPVNLSRDAAEFTSDLQNKAMILNNCELAKRLKMIPADPPYEVADCFVAQQVWHLYASLAAAGRAMEFLDAAPSRSPSRMSPQAAASASGVR